MLIKRAKIGYVKLVINCDILQWLLRIKRILQMSGAAPKTRPKVPEGKSQFLTTTQKKIKEGAFHVGYTTTWEPFQKEVKYTTPKKP